jgi:hypothetical protein
VEVADRYAQRLHELFKACGVAVELLEDRLAGELDLGLRLAGLERLSEVTPEPVGPGVAHLEEPPDIGGALRVEERRRFGTVAVAAVGALSIALEEAQRDQRVEKVVDRPRVQPEPCTDFLTRHRRATQMAEQVQLDGREQSLRRPEPDADFHDVRRIQLGVRHVCFTCLGHAPTVGSE